MTARFLFSVFAGLVLGLGAWLVVSAQQPGTKPPVEQEDPNAGKKPPKKIPIEEEEDPGARKSKKPPIVVVDDDPKAPAPRPAAEASGPVPPALREFVKRVETPHDRFLDKKGRWQNLAPVKEYVGNNPGRIHGYLKVQTLKDNLETDRSQELARENIERVEHYEDLVQQEVHNLFDKYVDMPPGSPEYVPLPRLIEVAQNVLAKALEWHVAARKDNTRVGDEWNGVGQRLRARLLDTRLLPLVNVKEPGDWKQATALARKVAAAQSEPEERKVIAQHLAAQVQTNLKRGLYSDVQVLQVAEELRRLDDVLPAGVASGPADDYLRQKAEQLTQQAKEYEQAGRLQEASIALNTAAQLWPRLPGLQDRLLQQNQTYQILRVGARSLPRYIVPGLTCTDSERQAEELVFESLVRPRLDPDSGQRYVPDLAVELPQVTAAGRQFLLRPRLFWSNGEPVTAADVLNTVHLLKTPGWPGYRAALADQLGDPPSGSEPKQITLSLRQSTLDPLGLLSFKILPRDLSLDTMTAFRDPPTGPIGTGPYQFRGIQEPKDRPRYSRFVANPNYSAREGKEGSPHLREVVFYESKDPVADLRDNKIDLCLDLPAAAIKDVGKLDNVKTLTLPPGRRVYFLAVNQQKLHTKLHNVELRRALARAINRDELLNSFRLPKEGVRHHVLHGPYPADSWAYETRPPSPEPDPLYNPSQAKFLLSEAKKPENGGLPTKRLELVYPDDDPRVKEAMLKLCEQVKKNLDLTLEPRAVEPHLLRQLVEGTPFIEGREIPFEYDLAYYSYDYPSEAYWLWPLFDPSPRAREKGGGNFLGYANDSSLEQQFRIAMSQRGFPEVKLTTNLIASLVEDRMPLIPLWQLDRVLAVRRELVLPADLDPLLLFADIDQWEWKRR